MSKDMVWNLHNIVQHNEFIDDHFPKALTIQKGKIDIRLWESKI